MLFKSNSLKAGGSVATAGYLYLLILHSVLNAHESILCFFPQCGSFFNPTPLPGGLQPFLSKCANHTHKWEHPFGAHIPVVSQFYTVPHSAQLVRISPVLLWPRWEVVGQGRWVSATSPRPAHHRSHQPSCSDMLVPLSSSCVWLALALKVFFSLGIMNWQNSFHLKSRTLFHGVFSAKITDYGKMQCCTSAALHVLFKKVYEGNLLASWN